jgi:hypothetical protein
MSAMHKRFVRATRADDDFDVAVAATAAPDPSAQQGEQESDFYSSIISSGSTTADTPTPTPTTLLTTTTSTSTTSDNTLKPFDCAVCNERITSMSESEHTKTTLHLFNLKIEPAHRPFTICENNTGYRLLQQSGWKETGLGKREQGRLQPIKTRLKPDRLGVGKASAMPLRISHSPANPTRQLANRLAQVKSTTVASHQVDFFESLRCINVAKRRDAILQETIPSSSSSRAVRSRNQQREQLRNQLIHDEIFRDF